MRSNLIFCVVLGLASAAYAKDPKAYQSGKLVQMDSVQCGVAENSNGKKTQDVLCQEYVLQAQQVTYRIRPRNEKHAVLLPVSDLARFRVERDKMLLRVEDFDNKERAFIVVSMAPRTDSSTADATPVRLNHLQ
jgi:hypothetical protein